MADEYGKLSDGDRRQVELWLSHPDHNHNCPICSVNGWVLSGHLLKGTAYSRDTLLMGSISYPMVMLSCDNCGYVRTFMAEKVGIKIEGKDE